MDVLGAASPMARDAHTADPGGAGRARAGRRPSLSASHSISALLVEHLYGHPELLRKATPTPQPFFKASVGKVRFFFSPFHCASIHLILHNTSLCLLGREYSPSFHHQLPQPIIHTFTY